MTATQAPTPGPLSVGNLHTAIMEALAEDIQRQRPDAFREEDENGFEGDVIIPTGATPRSAFAKVNVSDLAEVILPLVAPTAPVEASGSEREHGPKCWGKTSISDEMMYCYCGSTDSPQSSGETREAVLKGVGKVNGDGWKDTTTKGETVFVWNAEKPAPYAPGQYPRVGNEGWSASTLQYDFTPAAADDVPAILNALSARPLALGGQQGGIADIAAERRRQVEAEGWSVENDDEHDDCSLAHAAAAYALGKSVGSKLASYQDDISGGRGETAVWGVQKKQVPIPWPSSWDARWWKPTNRRRDLVKAGALIVAEIERLDRAEGAK